MSARLLRAAVVASVLGASSLALAAETVPLASVDSYERHSGQFTIVATVVGESAAKTIELNTYQYGDYVSTMSYGDSCERMLMVMMNRPGRFRLELRSEYNDGKAVCKLVRQ